MEGCSYPLVANVAILAFAELAIVTEEQSTLLSSDCLKLAGGEASMRLVVVVKHKKTSKNRGQVTAARLASLSTLNNTCCIGF